MAIDHIERARKSSVTDVLSNVFGTIDIISVTAMPSPVYRLGQPTADLRNRRFDGSTEQDHAEAQHALDSTISNAEDHAVGVKFKCPHGEIMVSPDGGDSGGDLIHFSWREICELYDKRCIETILSIKKSFNAKVLTIGDNTYKPQFHEQIQVNQSKLETGGWDGR